MGYFRELPNFEYISPLSDRNKDNEYIMAKNLFRRVKLVDDFQNSTTNFEKYYIKDGMRPDQVAAYYYGRADYMWLIYLANDIVDPFYGWPLTNSQLEDFIRDKYGSTAAAKALILHYTHKTKGHTISKDTYDNNSISNIVGGQYSPVYAYNFELEKNEAKRNIKLIDKRLASTAFQKLRDVMLENE